MNWNSPLFLLCSIAGLLLVSGSLYLLLKGIIDLKGGQGVSEMELPGGAKIKTPVPALLMFLLGVFMVVFPVQKSPELCLDRRVHTNGPLEMVKLRGKVVTTSATTSARVEVNAVVDSQEASASKDFVLEVPYVANRRYIVRYFARDGGGRELDKETVILAQGKQLHELTGVQLQGPVPTPEQEVKVEQTESAAVAAKYGR